MPMPAAGAPAPDFTLPDQNGNPISLAQLAGKKVVVYFYPKDDTPGCTVEACGFRDDWSAIEKTGAVVLGISPDDDRSHQKFIAKYGLPFTLLSDVNHQVAEKYGAWGEKNNYGKTYMGILRSTFLVDESGKLARVWPKVSVQGHSQEVLAAIKGEAAPVTAAKPKPAPKKPAAKKTAKPKPAAKKTAKPAKRAAAKKPAKKPAKKVASKRPAAKKVPAKRSRSQRA